MENISNTIIARITLFISFLLPFWFVSSFYSPLAGISASFVVIILWIFFNTKDKIFDSYFWMIINILLSLSFIFRSDVVLLTFNFLFLLYGLCFQIYNKKPDFKYTIWNIPLMPIFVLAEIFVGKSDYKLELGKVFSKIKTTSSEKKVEEIDDSKKPDKVADIVIGLVITFFVLAIILPLMASSNPIFADYLGNFFNLSFLRDIFSAVMFVRIFNGLILFLLLIRIINGLQKKTDESSIKPIKTGLFSNTLINVPKIATILVLALFFVAQIQLYLASGSPEALENLEIGYGQLNKDVFLQLTVVNIIVFVLVFLDYNKQKFNKINNWILLVQSLFLTMVASNSLFDYINNYGLTFIRLYGLTLLVLIIGVMVFLAVRNYFDLSENWFSRQLVAFVFIVLIGVNVANFPYLIFSLNSPKTTEDYISIYREASDSYDSYNLDKIWSKYQEIKAEKENSSDFSGVDRFYGDFYGDIDEVAMKIKFLQEKYDPKNENNGITTFNLPEYLNYQKVKNIDYLEILNTKKTPTNDDENQEFESEDEEWENITEPQSPNVPQISNSSTSEISNSNQSQI
jgi:Domain of unknown function (DUF4173)